MRWREIVIHVHILFVVVFSTLASLVFGSIESAVVFDTFYHVVLVAIHLELVTFVSESGLVVRHFISIAHERRQIVFFIGRSLVEVEVVLNFGYGRVVVVGELCKRGGSEL
jgi:hypothetical protein